MNSLWIQGIPILPSFNNKYNISNKDCKINNTTTNCPGCPSRIHFNDTSYTLSFGHLFSGNLQCYPSFNSICQCYKPCSYEVPYPLNNISQMDNIQCQQDPIINYKVDEAMETIRKTKKNIENQCNYSLPSSSYRCNRVMNNCNQNNIAKAAELLERAANAMSIAANPQNQIRL